MQQASALILLKNIATIMLNKELYEKDLKEMEDKIPDLQQKIRDAKDAEKLDEMYRLQQQEKHTWRAISYLKDPETLYARKYFERHLKCYRPWEITLGKDLAERYNIKSLVDFGCGCGSYLEGAQQTGVEIKGYELMHDIIKDILPEEVALHIEFGDVMQPIACKKFDCAMSIETAEHIVPNHSEILIKNLTNAATRLIFFTAARPGQGGAGHMNFKSRGEWIEMFKQNNFLYLEEEVEKTREIWLKILAKKFRYLIRNLVIVECKHD